VDLGGIASEIAPSRSAELGDVGDGFPPPEHPLAIIASALA
jgi:hypothetical protein